MVYLIFGAVLSGCLINWLFISPFCHPFLPSILKMLPIILSFLGGLICTFIILNRESYWLRINFLLNFNCYI